MTARPDCSRCGSRRAMFPNLDGTACYVCSHREYDDLDIALELAANSRPSSKGVRHCIDCARRLPAHSPWATKRCKPCYLASVMKVVTV